MKKKNLLEFINADNLNIISGDEPEIDINTPSKSTKTTDDDVNISRQTRNADYYTLIGMYPFRENEDKENGENYKSLLEKLSELEHKQWEEWSKNIAKTEDLSDERIERWKKDWIPYNKLDDETKEFDRIWARKAMDIIQKHLDQILKKNQDLKKVEEIVEDIINKNDSYSDILDKSATELPTIDDITNPIVSKKLSDLINILNMDNENEVDKLAVVSTLINKLGLNHLTSSAKSLLIKKITNSTDNSL